MRVAAIELNATDDVDHNRQTAGRRGRAMAARGAELGIELVAGSFAELGSDAPRAIRAWLPTLGRRVPSAYRWGEPTS